MSDLLKLFTAILNFFQPLLQGTFQHVSQRIHKIYNLINYVVDKEELGINQMLIYRIHNGGGNLSSSKSTYASIVYEEFRKPLHSVREKYQNIPVDKFFMTLIQDIRVGDSVIVDVPTMVDCNFKNTFRVQNISRAKFYFLKETKGGFLWRQTKEMHVAVICTINPLATLTEVVLEEDMTQVISDIKRNL